MATALGGGTSVAAAATMEGLAARRAQLEARMTELKAQQQHQDGTQQYDSIANAGGGGGGNGGGGGGAAAVAAGVAAQDPCDNHGHGAGRRLTAELGEVGLLWSAESATSAAHSAAAEEGKAAGTPTK